MIQIQINLLIISYLLKGEGVTHSGHKFIFLQLLQDDLDPRPHLEWFDVDSLSKLRQDLGACIMNDWEKATPTQSQKDDICLIM